MLAKNVDKIPFKDSKISETDEKSFSFPVSADVTNIYLKKIDGTIINHNDRSMRFGDQRIADKGDVIIITFIRDNISADLIMEDIFSYSSTTIDYGISIYKTRNICITLRSESSTVNQQAKYHIDMPWSDLISVNANIVYLSDAKYIR